MDFLLIIAYCRGSQNTIAFFHVDGNFSFIISFFADPSHYIPQAPQLRVTSLPFLSPSTCDEAGDCAEAVPLRQPESGTNNPNNFILFLLEQDQISESIVFSNSQASSTTKE